MRRLGALIGSVALAACLGLSAAAGPGGATTVRAGVTLRDATAPNIVLITSDDQAAFELRWMPKTRKLLGRAGVRFENMIAPHPNCCPSRAQILTGQYAQNNGVTTNTPPNGGWAGLTSATALPVWLQRAGYRTGFVGKYLHGYDETQPVEPGWERFRPIVTKPLSNYYGVLQYDHGVVRQFPEHVYHTGLVSLQSRGMIEELADGDAPFFLWSSYLAPHGTCATSAMPSCSGPPPASAKYRDLRPGVRLPSLDSPSYNEADLSDKPKKLHRKRVWGKTQQRLFTARLRALASLDDAVASTMHTLERAGVLENTVILFTSDNGYMFGEHRRTGKVLAYEESIRVPLLIRGPGIPAGQVRRQTVATIDLAPTIARLAGADPLVRVDGINIKRYAIHDAPQGDRALLLQSGHGSQPDAWYYRAIRTDRYTFIDWPEARDELYDRRVDPWQLRNVSARRDHRRTKSQLTGLLRQLETCSGRSCRVDGRSR